MIPGFMPSDYEMYAAMVEANFNEVQWEAIDHRKKARAIAFYRFKQQIKLHESEARADEELERARRANQ